MQSSPVFAINSLQCRPSWMLTSNWWNIFLYSSSWSVMEVVRTDQRVLSLRAFVQNKQTPDRQTRNKTHQSWEFAISSVCQTEGTSNFQNMQIWTLDSSDTEYQKSTNYKRRLQVFATLQVPLQWRRFTSTVNWKKMFNRTCSLDLNLHLSNSTICILFCIKDTCQIVLHLCTLSV